MWIEVILTALLACLIRKYVSSRSDRGDLDRIPGPVPSSNLWSYITGRRPDPYKTHLTFSALARQYGPIFKIWQDYRPVVVVSSYEGIFQVMVKGGKEIRGRNHSFRFHSIFQKTGILGSIETDATWKALRKLTQHHLKQFGEGMNRLETSISTISEDMFTEFDNHIGKPFDPRKVIGDTAIKTLALLITGERTRTGDPIVEIMREYEQLFFHCLPVIVPAEVKILDSFPWLRYFGLPSWKLFQRLLKLEDDIWECAREMDEGNPASNSLTRVFKERIVNSDAVRLTETDARKSLMSLLAAGRSTTTNTFHALINILAHHGDIQDRLAEEIERVTGGRRDICLDDKAQLQYNRATLLETHRFVSVVSTGVVNTTTQKTQLLGYTIPEDAIVLANLWELHHNPDFWCDPYTFRPERFLDEQGLVVPADHPNRKHLMPFGAGLRVCLGETMANTRLLLWIAGMLQRYKIQPAEGNHKQLCDPRGYLYQSQLRPSPYKVIFTKRPHS